MCSQEAKVVSSWRFHRLLARELFIDQLRVAISRHLWNVRRRYFLFLQFDPVDVSEEGVPLDLLEFAALLYAADPFFRLDS